MRILLIGHSGFGEHVLRRLLEAGEEIVGVSAPATPEGSRPDPLRVLAEKNALPAFVTRDLKTEPVFQRLAALKPDLGVMAYATEILPKKVLDLPALGTIAYHPSLLPKHRGASAINWAIIKGDAATGLTIFWPDSGIDSGPILLQQNIEIAPTDTLSSLYFNKLFPLGVEALLKAVSLVKEGRAPRVPQDGTQASYEGICREGDAVIDWAKPAREVYDLIRGCNPLPGASTTHRYKKVQILGCSLEQGEGKGKPGQVAEVQADTFTVALNGGTLRVCSLRPAGERKMSAREYVSAGRINTGEVLG